MLFKEYKEIIFSSWEEWCRIPRMFVSTLNELFAETLDDCIVYPKDLFFLSESKKRLFFIFSPQKLYLIEYDNTFHEIKSINYGEMKYILKREADYSIQVDLNIEDKIIQLNPLSDSNNSWEQKYHKYLIEIINFLERQ